MALTEFLEHPQRDALRLELLDGEIFTKAELEPRNFAIASGLGARLDEFGFAGVEARIVMGECSGFGPSCPIPDVVLFMNKPELQGDLPVSAPHLIVDLTPSSPHRSSQRKRIRIFLAAGVRAVWLIDTARRCVDVHETGRQRKLTGTDEVTVPGVAGLSFRVSSLFSDGEPHVPARSA
jgi:Uma2 family endonuclease